MGVDRSIRWLLHMVSRIPHTRGGGPRRGLPPLHLHGYSPHTWGWTGGERYIGDHLGGAVGADYANPYGQGRIEVIGESAPDRRHGGMGVGGAVADGSGRGARGITREKARTGVTASWLIAIFGIQIG